MFQISSSSSTKIIVAFVVSRPFGKVITRIASSGESSGQAPALFEAQSWSLL